MSESTTALRALERTTPKRVPLSRAKGWRLPDGAVKVDRTTKFGNPFVVGRDGTRAECVDLYTKMLAGYLALASGPSIEEQKAARRHVLENLEYLRGKDLACWCKGSPCHADVLLELANR